jgi:sugar/nucleoside kinase (ribokinase family)
MISNMPLSSKTPEQPRPIEAVVVGNVAFDVLCYPVNEVPRYHSLTFEKAALAPGGCGSNAAIGLAAQDIATALVACIGQDLPGDLAMSFWHQYNVDTHYVIRTPHADTGVSVGLIDDDAQPRFVHTSGSNQYLTLNKIPSAALLQHPPKAFHLAGFFLIPGLLVPELGLLLQQLQQAHVFTSMDVQQTARLSQSKILSELLPYLDIFSCNLVEASQITGLVDERAAARYLHTMGARTVIIKLGARGCVLSTADSQEVVPAPKVQVVDTTGAGDAFSAGLIAAIIRGESLMAACQWANAVAARIVTQFGAVAAWETYRAQEQQESTNG